MNRYCIPLTVLAISASIFWLPLAAASTFVGNGGSAGEVETRVSVAHLTDVLSVIEKLHDQSSEELDICRCADEFQNHAMCAPIRELNKTQRRFCSGTLEKKSADLHALVSGSEIRLVWTNDQMEVSEGGQRRVVDAVADRAARTITLNQNRFLQMKPYERLFLLAHEYFHFLQIDDQALVDTGSVGPFDQTDGSKRLIDAMAASVVMKALDYRILDRYQEPLRRAQGWKTNWLELTFGSQQAFQRSKDLYANHRLQEVGLNYLHYFGNFGLAFSFEGQSADAQLLQTIHTKENLRIFGLGVTYRHFPFSDPLTYFGQTHFVWLVELLNISGTYQATDADPDLIAHAASNVFGGRAQVSYHFPVVLGLWGVLGAGYDYQPLRYDLDATPGASYRIKTDSNRLSTYAGVSYGF
jgi:hypothetical protein